MPCQPIMQALRVWILAACSQAAMSQTVVQTPPNIPANVRATASRASAASQVTLGVGVSQSNLDQIQSCALSVSDPTSQEYQAYWSAARIANVTAPAPAARAAVSTWLQASGMTLLTSGASGWVLATGSVSAVEAMLLTEIMAHRSATGNVSHYHRTPLQAPEHLAMHLDVIVGLDLRSHHTWEVTGFQDGSPSPTASSTQVSYPDFSFQEFNVSALKKLYQVPAELRAVSAASQGVVNFKNVGASHRALASFNAKYGTDGAISKAWYNGNVISNASLIYPGSAAYPAIQSSPEPDLDVQYLTGMAAGATTWEWFGESFIEIWADHVAELEEAPSVFSISWAATFSELYGAAYISRANRGLMKLACRGISVVVASGDWGSPGQDTTNCPNDMAYNVNLTCTNMLVNHRVSQAGEDPWSYPGVFPNIMPTVMADTWLQASQLASFYSDLNSAFVKANPGCISRSKYEVTGVMIWSTDCACDAVQPFSVELSVPSHYSTYAVFNFSKYEFEESNGLPLLPGFPSSSPWVTSVGGTQLIAGSTTQEAVMSIKSIYANKKGLSTLTTGGGFALTQPRPAYQEAAVSAWLALANPSQGYNYTQYGSTKHTMRGYPDVSLISCPYPIFTEINGAVQARDMQGTSASSPTFAGMLSLINSALLQQGSPVVGFANPLLYALAQQDSSAFNDVTQGDVNCGNGYCCKYGYTATKGWDPASGLGTVNFPKLLQYALAHTAYTAPELTIRFQTRVSFATELSSGDQTAVLGVYIALLDTIVPYLTWTSTAITPTSRRLVAYNLAATGTGRINTGDLDTASSTFASSLTSRLSAIDSSASAAAFTYTVTAGSTADDSSSSWFSGWVIAVIVVGALCAIGLATFVVWRYRQSLFGQDTNLGNQETDSHTDTNHGDATLAPNTEGPVPKMQGDLSMVTMGNSYQIQVNPMATVTTSEVEPVIEL